MKSSHLRLASTITSAKSPSVGLGGLGPSSIIYGVIQSIQAGPPPSLTVRLAGSTLSVAGIAYLGTYYPTVADVVAILKTGADYLVMGPAAGTLLSTPQSATVATSQTTANTTYVDLATPGPTVTLNTKTSVIVMMSCHLGTSVQFQSSLMAVAVSGATTIAAADANAIGQHDPDTTSALQVARIFKLAGLTAGSNVFTAKYRGTGAATATFDNRDLTVIALPS